MKHIYKLLFVFVILMTLTSTVTTAENQAIAESQSALPVIFVPGNDNFLRIESILGESHDARHVNEIDILSWSFGAASGGETGGSGATKPTFSDFIVVKKFDKSSPKLFLAELTGQKIPNMKLTVRKKGENPLEFLKITFENVLVTKYDTSETESGVAEQISFSYEKIFIEYQEQKADGSPGDITTAGWDLKTNKPFAPPPVATSPPIPG